MLSSMGDVLASRMRQCANTLLCSVFVSTCNEGADMMHQGGGVCLSAIKEEGLANVCAHVQLLSFIHMLSGSHTEVTIANTNSQNC